MLRGHYGCIRAVAVFPDGLQVITGSEDCTAKIFNVRSGMVTNSLTGLDRQMRAVAVFEDGHRVLVGSDRDAKLWEQELDLPLQLVAAVQANGELMVTGTNLSGEV